jgi:membrane protease YdiL (CAAX protease family)
MRKGITTPIYSKTDKHICAIIYVCAGFFLWAPFGIAYILAMLAMMSILYPGWSELRNTISEGVTSRRNAIYTFCFTFIILFIRDILIEIGLGGPSLIFEGSVFFPSYLLLLNFAIPIVWGICSDREALRTFYYINKRILFALLLMIIPFVFTNLLLMLDNQHTSVYTTNILVELVFQLFIGAALGEELLFRGFLYNVLKKFMKTKWAIMVTSMLFSLSHIGLLTQVFRELNMFSLFNLVVIFFLGVMTCLLYEKSKSLILPIAFHALFNGTLGYLLMLII